MGTLFESRLYAIIDLGYVPPDRAGDLLKALIEGGVDIVQLRGKTYSVDELTRVAEELLAITSPANIPLIVNDHAEIGRRIAIQGVHVGQDDEPIARVRAAVARPICVGKSTHSFSQAVAAQAEGADYLGFGPVFATPTKPDYPPTGLEGIGKVQEQVQLPVFCIGGIKLANLPQVTAAGGRRVAVVSALLQSDNPRNYARHLKELLPH